MRYNNRVVVQYKSNKRYDPEQGRVIAGWKQSEQVACHISHVNADIQQRHSDFLNINSRVIRIQGQLSDEVESVLIDDKKYKIAPIKQYDNKYTVLYVSEVVG